MSRRRKHSSPSTNSRSMNFENVFPSSPHRPPTINVWLKYGDDRIQIHSLCSRAAAKKYAEVALNGRDFSAVKGNPGWYTSDDGMLMFKFVGDVRDLMNDDTLDTDWEVPQPDYNQLLIAAGLETIQASGDEEVEKPNRVRKPRRPADAPPVSRDGLITLGEICDELKIEPRDARKLLRDKVQKPDAGWAWAPSEVPAIKKLLKK